MVKIQKWCELAIESMYFVTENFNFAYSRYQESMPQTDKHINFDGDDGFMSIIAPYFNLTGKDVFTSGHFLYPYNPIELE